MLASVEVITDCILTEVTKIQLWKVDFNLGWKRLGYFFQLF